MQKIGICACYDTENYGSMLQALALCRRLEQTGRTYEIIRYTRKAVPPLVLKSLDRIPEKLKKQLKKQREARQLAQYPAVQAGLQARRRRFSDFRQNAFPNLSTPCDTFRQLQQAAVQYTAVLAGSDQIWLPQGYATGFYTLQFVPDHIPKISYAASFGVSRIPARKRRAAACFLRRMDHISVREIRGAEIVQELTGRVVPVLPDPALLFDAAGWADLIPETPPAAPAGQAWIFCYLLGDNPQHRSQVQQLAHATGLPVVTVPHLDGFVPGDVGFGNYELYEIGPAEFLNLIRNAAMVCTDSFHGTVFSILHHRPFVTFDRFAAESRQSRNSRIDTLLLQTGLQARRIRKNTEICAVMQAPIDYAAVDAGLASLRQDALAWLEDVLPQCGGGR